MAEERVDRQTNKIHRMYCIPYIHKDMRGLRQDRKHITCVSFINLVLLSESNSYTQADIK